MQLGILLGSGTGADQPPNAPLLPIITLLGSPSSLGSIQRCLAQCWPHHTNKEECVVANTGTDLSRKLGPRMDPAKLIFYKDFSLSLSFTLSLCLYLAMFRTPENRGLLWKC